MVVNGQNMTYKFYKVV